MKTKQLLKIIALTLLVISMNALSPLKGQVNNLLMQQEVNAASIMKSQIINGVNYETMSDNTVRVGRCFTTEGDVVLESSVGGLPVTLISDSAFFQCTKLTSIVIPDSVTVIGSDAFYMCTSLVDINIPNTVVEIRAGAFRDCTSLVSIVLPNSITTMGISVFKSCTSLKNVVLPNSLDGLINQTFSECTGLEDVVIPDTYTYIGAYAFDKCTSLGNINIPTSVTSIGEYAFYQCGKISELILPNSIVTIGKQAYYYCSNIHKLIIPESVTTIGDEAFYYSGNFPYAELPETVINVGKDIFRNAQVIKGPKDWVDNEITKPRVYLYDVDGTTLLAAYSVREYCDVTVAPDIIGKEWEKLTGSNMNMITEDSTFKVKGKPINLEAPTLTASKVDAKNREVGIAISLK